MKHLPTRVVKIGGSLLDLDSLPQRIREWRAAQPDGRNLMFMGGGAAVEALRNQPLLSSEEAHWRAIDQMDENTRQMAARLAEVPLYGACDQILPTSHEPADAFVEVGRFLRLSEPNLAGAKLPVGWHVTSDSIAARLAQVIRADEVVLLKSALPPTADIDELARIGYVDQHFPVIAQGLATITCCSLHSTPPARYQLHSKTRP